MADTLRRSTSKVAHVSGATLSTRPRGVRLFAAKPPPAFLASTTDEKNGKSGSTHGVVVVATEPCAKKRTVRSGVITDNAATAKTMTV
jgi:hypothetical protein